MNDKKESPDFDKGKVYDFNQPNSEVNYEGDQTPIRGNFLLDRKDLDEDFPDVRDRAKERLNELGVTHPELGGDGLAKYTVMDSLDETNNVIDASDRFKKINEEPDKD